MSRKPRFALPSVPQHVIQRGNNRQPCFFTDDDYRFYLECVQTSGERYDCAIHAYVLMMANHVPMLVTPRAEDSIPRFVQHIGRRYVQYINYTHRRSGTLWEGRDKASLVDAEPYLFICHRYIELNPVRAKMVESPATYPWTSYLHNALGHPDPVLTPHAMYLSMGRDEPERQSAYRGLFNGQLSDKALAKIRQTVNQEKVLGRGGFREIERTLARRSRPPL